MCQRGAFLSLWLRANFLKIAAQFWGFSPILILLLQLVSLYLFLPGGSVSITEVAVVGAGPYGLSIAAHLAHRGIQVRIFGSPMETWRRQMPRGMLLKSDGFASNLADPARQYELRHFCAEHHIPYGNTGVPVKLDTFANYGVAFQQRFLPHLEDIKVRSIERHGSRFRLACDDGTELLANRVIVATGISYYSFVPEALEHLPDAMLRHSHKVRDPNVYCGKSVAVVGGGASALDLAALLHEGGAKVSVVARRPRVIFSDPPPNRPRTFLEQLRAPGSGVGPGWKSRLITEFPGLFRLLPLAYRLSAVKRFLGPLGGWPMRDRVIGKVDLLTGCTPVAAEERNGQAVLTLAVNDGSTRTLAVDHVVAATGYKARLSRLPFLEDSLRREINSAEDTPILSANFESSVPGLYFVGISAANTFGPMMRFAFGARYTARRITRHLAGRVRRQTREATSLQAEQESLPVQVEMR